MRFVRQKESKIYSGTSSGFEEINDLLNSRVGFVIGGLQLGVGLMGRIGFVMKAAVGKWATETLVEEEEQEGYLDAFGSKPVAVAGTVAVKQAVAFEFTQIVAQLVEAIGFVGKVETGEDGMVDLLGRPTSGLSSGMQEDLQQANDACFMDFDTWVTNRADGNGQGEALKQWEIDMDVEPVGLEGGEAVGDLKEPLLDCQQVIESLFQSEVGQVIGA